MIVQAHTLTIVQLNVTGDRSRCHCEQKLSGIGATANDRRRRWDANSRTILLSALSRLLIFLESSVSRSFKML